ncbi:MAG: hypothetical protein L6Q99_21200 [Planctomycetes bacterium]|nr:hypothetical protein [Planctomycetota bacterium]
MGGAERADVDVVARERDRLSVVVTNVTCSIAPPAAQANGLLGWVRFRAGQFQFDSVALRRTAEGRLGLSFPTRRDLHGVEHCYVHPVEVETRRAIEIQVFDALAKDGRLAS